MEQETCPEERKILSSGIKKLFQQTAKISISQHKLQEELDKNEEYKDLLLERKEILRSNGFINKLQPRFEAICERLQEIDNETIEGF